MKTVPVERTSTPANFAFASIKRAPYVTEQTIYEVVVAAIPHTERRL
jgi:hypothetical protein